jgi:ATP-dependent RNA helicase DOB1
VVNFQPRHPSRELKEALTPQTSFVVDVLLAVAEGGTNGTKLSDEIPAGVRPAGEGEKSTMQVLPVLLNCLDAISHVRIFLPEDLRSNEQRNTLKKSMDEVKKRFPDGLAILDPIENMGITDESFKRLIRKIETLEARLLSNPLHNSPRLPSLYDQYAEKKDIGAQMREVKKQIDKATAVIQLEELKSRKRVLRRFGYINEAEVVQLKARVACEISTGDELLLTELLFDGFFNELKPEHCAALLSCFVFDEKVVAEPPKEELAKLYREVERHARIIVKVTQESKLPVNEDEYVAKLKWHLIEVVYAWANGRSFAEIWYASPRPC